MDNGEDVKRNHNIKMKEKKHKLNKLRYIK